MQLHRSNPKKIHNQSFPFPSRQNKFTKACIELLNSANFDKFMQFKHASLIVKNGKIIGSGVNNAKSHPMAIKPVLWMNKNSPLLDSLWTLHAEMCAIKSVKNKNQLNGASIYIARQSICHGMRLSAPCEFCEYYIRKYKISRVIYTTDDQHWNEVRI